MRCVRKVRRHGRFQISLIMHFLVCFEKDNIKQEENVNHISRLGIGTRAGRNKKKKKKKKSGNCTFEIFVCD